MAMTLSPRHADEFATLAERRAWVDSLPDERVRITTTPTGKRLRAANDNSRLAALAAIDALTAPHQPDCLPDPAVMMDKEAVGKGWRIRPSEGEMWRAWTLGRVAVRSAPGRIHAERSSGGTVHIGPLVFTRTRRTERGPVLMMGEVVTGDITVPAGAMVERGRTRKGAVLKPSEYRTYERPDAETKRRAELDTKRAIKAYLKLSGTWDGYENWADRMGGVARSIERPPAARDLVAAGVDGAIDLASARLNAGLSPAAKCSDGYLWRGHWHGGVTRTDGRAGGHDGHAKRAHDAAMRILTQKWLAERLDGDEHLILALATSSATASQAGADLGMTRQRFVRAANDVLKKVSTLLAEA